MGWFEWDENISKNENIEDQKIYFLGNSWILYLFNKLLRWVCVYVCVVPNSNKTFHSFKMLRSINLQCPSQHFDVRRSKPAWFKYLDF